MTTPNVNTDISKGKHYKNATISRTCIGQPLDPFMIDHIYRMAGLSLSAGQLTIIKKTLALGKRGNKTVEQDLHDIIGACSRMLELNALPTEELEDYVHEFQ